MKKISLLAVIVAALSFGPVSAEHKHVENNGGHKDATDHAGKKADKKADTAKDEAAQTPTDADANAETSPAK